MFLRLFSILFIGLALALPAAAGTGKTALIFGDSLSAGFGLSREQSWPSLLAQRLTAERGAYRVVNASISGETSAGGRSRIAAALAEFQPTVVVVELGANDGLRGLPVAQLRENLSAIVRAARASKARVLLIGMKLPPNYGADYGIDFERSFAHVAKAEKCALLPFLLEPIAADRTAFQADGLHPVAAAQPRILDHVWIALKPLL